MAKKKSGFSPAAKKKKDIPNPSVSSKPFFRSVGGLLLLCGLLSVLVVGTFWPSVHCLFQIYDENDYLLANTRINHGLTWKGVCWAFTALDKSNWVPLTWLTHMMDFQIYGGNPWGHHLTNILIHAANVSLLFLLFRRMTGSVGRSFVVAALFAIHPLRVESVTWISERKDVLSFFFGMLGFLAYVRYAEEMRKVSGKPHRFYLLTLLLFVLSLMSKATLVTFPCLLLLLDYWPLGRISNFKLDRTALHLFTEKIPFFLLIIPTSIVAKMAEQAGNSILLHPPLMMRLQTALISYMRYLGYMFWPENLSSNYPYPKSWPVGELWLAIAILVALSALALVLYKRRPYFLIGWLWFIGTLVPVNGIIEQIGSPTMADRYSYVPMVGILLIVVWGAKDVAESLRIRPALLWAPASIAAILFIAVTRHDIGYWQDSVTRWVRVTAVTKDNWTAYANLGVTFKSTDPDRALDCYEKAVAINPDFVEAQRELGACLIGHKRYEEAIEHSRIAWTQNTDDPRPQWNVGVGYFYTGNVKEAIFHFEMAYVLEPNNIAYAVPLAQILMQQQRFADAIPVTKSLCAIQTNNAENFNMLGCALAQTGQLDAALRALQTALSLVPNDAGLQSNIDQVIKLKQQKASSPSPTNSVGVVLPAARNDFK
ncbi:MAG TPA: tetratricopeptide repeat protein [Verrucomicrobiae bacterium]|jgi:tetratricopeptide (TPR) repeat protein